MSEQKKAGAYGTAGQDTNFRRTWDKDEYERRAKERDREQREREDDEDRKRKGLRPRGNGDRPNPPRDLLQARTTKLALDARLNKTEVVQAVGIASKTPGFFCDVCDCVLKDSKNYLDHINGKKHQKAKGMSMRVERSSTDQIKAKLEALKKKKEEGPVKAYDLDDRVLEVQAAEEEERRAKKERRRLRKEEEKKKAETEKKEEGLGDDDEAMKLMGFGSFGGSKK